MRNTLNFAACLALMILIALVEYRPPALQPVLSGISDHTDLARVLRAAKSAAEGK